MAAAGLLGPDLVIVDVMCEDGCKTTTYDSLSSHFPLTFSWEMTAEYVTS